MKSINYFLCFTFFFIGLNCSKIAAQDNLNVDSDLKSKSIPLKIKRKGISAIGKYEFDGYKLISGKSGWSTSKSNTSFKSNSKTSTKNKKAFVFVNKENDSVIANLAQNSDAEILVDSIINLWIGNTLAIEAKNNFFNRTFFKWEGRTLKKGSETFVANFLFLKDNSSWDLTMVSPIMVEVDGNFQMDTTTEFNALLSNGITDIEIKRIYHNEDAKISLIRGPAAGYEFYINNMAVAALQYRPIDRMFIWMHNDLDENLKFVLAATSTALLVKEF
jgi:hypothetical protein